MTEPIETDLPLAFLAGYPRRLQSLHPDPLAQRGLSGFNEGQINGVTRHFANTVLHGAGIRTRAEIIRPGWNRAEPQAALCDLMMRFELATLKDLSGGFDMCPGPKAHAYGFGPLVVDGVQYNAIELREHGVVARAAVVAGGWTVLACVPDDVASMPAVELEAAEAAVATSSI